MKSFLFILPTDKVGGAERVAMNLIRYISILYPSSNVSVYFLYGGYSGAWDEFMNHNNVVLYYNNFKSEKASLGYTAYKLTKSFKYIDFIYTTHTHLNSLVCGLARIKLICPKNIVLRESTIITHRFIGIKKYIFNFLYQFYGLQDLLICQTNTMLNELKKARGPRISLNAVRITNPIHYDFITKKMNAHPVALSNKFRIVMVGRLVPIKNHELVILALSLLEKKLRACIVVDIVGSGTELNKLQYLIKKLDLGVQINFHGNMLNPYRLMKDSNLGIIASKSEGFPNVVLEMMACRVKNIITTPCAGDLDELPSVTITKTHNAEDMCLAIKTAIHNNLDYSQVYNNYISTRDISSYWNCILANLK